MVRKTKRGLLIQAQIIKKEDNSEELEDVLKCLTLVEVQTIIEIYEKLSKCMGVKDPGIEIQSFPIGDSLRRRNRKR